MEVILNFAICDDLVHLTSQGSWPYERLGNFETCDPNRRGAGGRGGGGWRSHFLR